MDSSEVSLVQDLARQYMEVASQDIQRMRRGLWRSHNSLKFTRPPIYVRAFAWREMPESKLKSSDPLCRELEQFLRQELFRSTFGDDYIIEPWHTVGAVCKRYGWGLNCAKHFAGELDTLEAYKVDHPIKNLEDAARLVPPFHAIDDKATAECVGRINSIIGGIVPLNLTRNPAYHNWSADLSTDLGHLRGMENVMLDMYENPEWLDKLLKFMSDGVLRAQDQAEAAGDIDLTFTYNQAMAYAEELPDPAPNTKGVNRSQLWNFTAAQEMALVSPEMHERFLLKHQLPIMSKYGLVAYGCCEDLTNKIDMLRKIPNLRRIAVSPFANVRRCAEQIGKDYVLSYRPSPADMVSYDWNPERVRKILRHDFEALKGTCFDITLKDVETVQSDPGRIREWVRIVRETIDEF